MGRRARMIAWAGAAALAACGTLESGSTAPVDASVPAEAGSTCNPAAAFGPARPLTQLNSGDIETPPRLTADELTVVFSSNRGNPGDPLAFDVYLATRADRTAPFDPPSRVDSIETGHGDSDPWISPQGLTLFFDSNRDADAGPLDFDLYRATRNARTAAFGGAQRLGAASATPHVDSAPFVNDAETEGFFSSTRPLGDAAVSLSSPHLWTFRLDNGVASAALPASIQRMDGDAESYPVLSHDALRLFFALRRGTATDTDIAYVDRTSTSADFGSPTVVPDVSASGVDDRPGFISADGCRLYFSRGSGTAADLYVAERGP